MMKNLTILALICFGVVTLAACSSTSTPELLSSAFDTTSPEQSKPLDKDEQSVKASALQQPDGGEIKVAAANRELVTNAIARVQLSPVVGAPESAVRLMSQRMAARSKERGIALVSPSTAGATHDLKGYFSAITEGGKTTVIYVWDIFDASGNRLHRIQGQESAPGTSPDGWSSVSASMMERIGSRTVDDFADWLSGQG